MKDERHRLEVIVESMFRTFIFWEKDDAGIGAVIRFLHRIFSYSMIFFYVVIHTILPSYTMFLIFYLIYSCVWLHNVICGGCVVTNIEQRMLNDTKGFMDPIFDYFGIPNTVEYANPVFVLFSSVMMLFFTVEFISMTARHIRDWLCMPRCGIAG
jgi:hypothetical protein